MKPAISLKKNGGGYRSKTPVTKKKTVSVWKRRASRGYRRGGHCWGLVLQRVGVPRASDSPPPILVPLRACFNFAKRIRHRKGSWFVLQGLVWVMLSVNVLQVVKAVRVTRFSLGNAIG